MSSLNFYPSLKEARPFIESIRTLQDGKKLTVGSVHTLGALHQGHGELIRKAAEENDIALVTVYPNKIQLFPGSIYQYSLEEDMQLAEKYGATHFITSNDEEMFPSGYNTFINQGEAYTRLNSSVFPFAARGQITGAIRWMIFTQPTRSYYGMKDIEQALLVKQAAADLLLHTEICLVPCIRHKDGIPISSRLRGLAEGPRKELSAVYETLEFGRKAILNGQKDVESLLELMKTRLAENLSSFKLLYVTAVDSSSFAPKQDLAIPLILHIAVQNEKISHFDGLCLLSKEDLMHGPNTIWLDH